MSDRISTLDSGYVTGDLSLFPLALDDKTSLYDVRNNAQTFLTQSLTYNAKFIVVDDARGFPDDGLITVGTESIFYASRTNTVFKDLKRGFAGSRQNQWTKNTIVGNTVQAEIHNASKDAVINMETKLGTTVSPSTTSLNGILKTQESRFLAPKPLFRAFPLHGPAGTTINFKNFSDGEPIRFLWDFGDGSRSVDINPSHTYLADGTYSVILKMITSLGAVGVITKTDYITIGDNEKPVFFYADQMTGDTSTIFTLIDQTDGDISSRYWIFDDGTSETVDDPDIHTITHTYSATGSYLPTLIIVFKDDTIKTATLKDKIVVS